MGSGVNERECVPSHACPALFPAWETTVTQDGAAPAYEVISGREMVPPALKICLSLPLQPDGQAAVHPQPFTDASQEETQRGECLSRIAQQRFTLGP